MSVLKNFAETHADRRRAKSWCGAREASFRAVPSPALRNLALSNSFPQCHNLPPSVTKRGYTCTSHLLRSVFQFRVLLTIHSLEQRTRTRITISLRESIRAGDNRPFRVSHGPGSSRTFFPRFTDAVLQCLKAWGGMRTCRLNAISFLLFRGAYIRRASS